MSHAVIDSERKARNQKVNAILQTQQLGLDANKGELRDSYLVGSITNLDKQHGNAMTSTAFMSKLRKLNRDLICKPHPHQTGFCNLYLALPDAEPMHLMPMEDWMPEWSVMGEQEVRKPLTNYTGYWAPTKTVGAEVKRGWRTVLVRLIEKGIVGLDAVEREFGAGNRPSWAALTGKHTSVRPLL